jgi:hypothetical protein
MAVVTLFFCGTGSNSTDSASKDKSYLNGELISRLGLRCSGEDTVTKFTIDGPGSGNRQEEWKIRGKKNYFVLKGLVKGKGWDENVMFAIDVLLGRVDRPLISPPKAARWIPDRDASRCFGCQTRFSGMIRSGKHHCRLCGQVFCETCTKNRLSIEDRLSSDGRQRGRHDEQRVCNTCFKDKFREYHEKEDKLRADEITRINCIGWSRGGVTTHMFANACDDEPLLKGKEIRLIAVDPVPGGEEMSKHRVQITNPALKEYVAFFARHERMRGFSPTLPLVGAGIQQKIYFFPGDHGSLVGNARRDKKLYDSAVLVRHIAETHLKDWGTTFEKTIQLSDDEVLRYYDQMVLHHRHFEKKFKPIHWVNQGGGRTMMRPPMPGDDGANNATWIKLQELDSDGKNECFVNWHHKDVARKRFPNCVAFINGVKLNPSFVRREIDDLKIHKLCPNLAAQMQLKLAAAEAHNRLQNRFAVRR